MHTFIAYIHTLERVLLFRDELFELSMTLNSGHKPSP